MRIATTMRLLRACTATMLAALLASLATAQPPEWPLLPDLANGQFDGAIFYQGALPGIDAQAEVTTSDTYDTAPRCLAHQLSVPSQGFHISGSGFHISGSVGGLVLGPIHVLDEGAPYSTIAASPVRSVWEVAGDDPVQSWDAWLAGRSPRSDTDVVILVADDFAGGRFELPADVFGLEQGQESDLEALVTNGELSHGALVMHHLNAMLGASGALRFDSSASDPGSGRTVWAFGSDASSRLIVQAFDLSTGQAGLIDTDMIVDRITGEAERKLISLVAPDSRTHFVLNMSWVLLPCPTVEAFINAEADFATFEAYLAALMVPSMQDGSLGVDYEYIANVLRLLSWVGPNDALFRAIHGDPADPAKPYMVDDHYPGARMAFVAATGNFGMEYQMLPAAWPLVVGAGAPEEPLPPFSNLAEVLAPGAWFMLEPVPELAASSLPNVSREVAYAGTSFSAPMVSLVTAIDLITEQRCTPTAFRAEAPGLASESPRGVPLRVALAGCAVGP